MATHDVPGFGIDPHGKLGMGCWAEADDGSLILVLNTEDDPAAGPRVIYEVFDLSVHPVIKYTDSMPRQGFEQTFSWTADGKKTPRDRWTWHDRTPFPWSRVMEAGMPAGSQYATADGLQTAAQRVANSRNLMRSRKIVTPDDIRHHVEILGRPAGRAIIDRIQQRIDRLQP